jgi:hypothetical protein
MSFFLEMDHSYKKKPTYKQRPVFLDHEVFMYASRCLHAFFNK